MTREEKISTLNRYYEAARQAGKAYNKSGFAELIGTNRSVLSAAFSGNEKYLTDTFLERVRKAVEGASQTTDEGYPVLVIPTEALAGSLVEFSAGVTEFECERME